VLSKRSALTSLAAESAAGREQGWTGRLNTQMRLAL
jgi:hypothetical protein